MDISSGKALIVSVVTGGPTLAWATFTNDFVPVATGAAVGIVMFLWSVRNTSNDQYIKNLHARIQESQSEIEKSQQEYFTNIQEIRSTLSDVQVEVKHHKYVLDQIKNKLAVHSCPVSADPSIKCQLPEAVISIISL